LKRDGRGTSVYFPDRVIPMLPERVSNHLCSLNPKVDRLALSVMMHLSRTGEVLDYSFHKSIIHSKERMTYEDVQEVLNGNGMLEQRFAAVVPHIRTILPAGTDRSKSGASSGGQSISTCRNRC
jgi:ribonuclease R